MKCLSLVTDAFGGRGGIAKFNRDFLTVLCHMPQISEVAVLPRLITDEMEALPAKLSYATGAAKGTAAYIRFVLAHVVRGDYDVVTCGHLNLLPIAALLAARRRAPLVVVVYGIEAWKPRSVLDRRLLRAASMVISISEFTLQRLTDWADLEADRVRVIPCSVNLDRFVPGPRRADLVERYDLAHRTVLMTVARLTVSDRYKGIDETLEVIPRLLTEIPDLAYLVVGDGDDRERLMLKARQLGIGDRVTFAGYVPEEEKADHYRLADVFVMPGRGEGFGIVYLEALACGVPVVASVADASREAVRNGLLGELADPESASTIRDAICRALARRSTRVLDGLDYFSDERFHERLTSAIGQVIGLTSTTAGAN